MVRCILYSNDNEREGVFFTEDFEMDSADVLPPGCNVVKDFTIDDNFPSIFPMEYNLERVF